MFEPDTELMLRVRMGDDTSFTLLLERYRTPVLRFLYRMVQNEAAAEELAQDVFLRVYRARHTYEPTAKVSSWLFCIATRRALNWKRDRRRERVYESLDRDAEDRPMPAVADHRPSVEQKLVERAGAYEIRRAIAVLPPKQRAAVIMHKYHDMDYSQIARALGCSESAVKSVLFRAYEHLRRSLAHLAPAPAFSRPGRREALAAA